MLDKETLKIMDANKPYKRMLEEYDETRKFALDKTRKSFTIKNQTYLTLKKQAKAKNTSMSNLIDEMTRKLA